MYDCTRSQTRQWTGETSERVDIAEMRKSRFMESVIMGTHPKMALLTVKYSGVVEKGDKFSILFADKTDMADGLQGIATHLFTIPTMDGEWHFPSIDASLEQIVVFLLFIYGIRLSVQNTRWFDLWYVIDRIQDYMPGFNVDDVEVVMSAECATSVTLQDSALASAMNATHI